MGDKERHVLDHGVVKLIDHMGSDYSILRAARVSTGGEEKKGDLRDRGLIRYLYKNKHTSPFEHVTFTFYIKAPIFVVRQWMRHRTWSYNEYSARYSELPEEFYMPTEFRKQSKINHQGSEESLSQDVTRSVMEGYKNTFKEIYKNYHEALNLQVAREQARGITPVAQYSHFYGTVNLWNLFHFLELRMHENAQDEIRVYAFAIYEMLKEIDDLKWSIEIFDQMRNINSTLDSLLLSYKDLDELNEKLKTLQK